MANAEKQIFPDTLDLQNRANIEIDLNFKLPSRKLTRLLTSLENALPENGPIVQFVSAYESQEANKLSFETAVIAAIQQNKRVLLIDANGQMKKPKTSFTDFNLETLGAALMGTHPLENCIAQLSHPNLFYSFFTKEGGNEDILAAPHQVERLLEALKTHFDLIVINAEGLLVNGSAALFAKHVDGSVLVVKAERTREPVLNQVKKMIEKEGGSILGCVMTNRKFYIPKWFYRLFFQSGS